MHCSFICHWRLHHHQPYYFKLFYDRPSAAKIKVKIYFLRGKKKMKEMKSHSLLKHHSRTNKKFKRKLILNLSEFRVLTNHRMAYIRSKHKDYPVPTSLLWTGLPPTASSILALKTPQDRASATSLGPIQTVPVPHHSLRIYSKH